MKVSVIGTGYVGLVTGACLASSGVRVLCCDTNQNKIAELEKGLLPIYEPGLDDLLADCTTGRRTLEFTSDMEKAVNHADILFITVNTPTLEDNSCDLGNVMDAVRKIALYMDSYKVVVDKSTVPVGTGQKVKSEIRRILAGRQEQLEFDVVSNPEFLKEGSAVEDFTRPDRIIIGAENPGAAELVMAVYGEQLKKGIPVLVTSLETAEMIKYASNAFLAAKVSFINEIANICELCSADVSEVACGMGLDGRIGPKFLKAGPGFGGSCFPKDLKALSGIARSRGYAPLVLESVMETNKRQRERMSAKIENILGKPENKTVSILGVSFKPDTDDIRESPAVYAIEKLLAGGAAVRVCDPRALGNFRRQYPQLAVEYSPDVYAACARSDCIVLMTEWEEFCGLDFEKLGNLVNQKAFLDLRNIYDPEYVRSFGFYYEGVGRK